MILKQYIELSDIILHKCPWFIFYCLWGLIPDCRDFQDTLDHIIDYKS